MVSSVASALGESKPLGNTWGDSECDFKLLLNPPSERSDLADTAASCESERSSDEASQHSNVVEETCPRCIGNGYHDSKLGAFTCKTCKGRGSADFKDEAIPGLPLGSAIVGVLVVRGPDWQCGDDDGGAGSVGEVVKDAGGGWVQVRWSNGHSDDYRAGFSNRRDLVVHEIMDVNGYASEQVASDAASLYAATMYAALCQQACMSANGMPFGWGIQDGSMMLTCGTQAQLPPLPVSRTPCPPLSTTRLQPLPVSRTPLRRDAALFVPQKFSR